MISGNGGKSSAFAGSAGQLKTGSILEELFILGLVFSWEDWITYGADETKIIVFDATLCGCDQLVFEPLIFSANSGPVPIDIYTNVTYDLGSGTPLQQSNRRETSLNTSDAIIRTGVTNFSGTRFAGDLIPSNGAATPNASGANNPRKIPFEIDVGKVKAIGLHNTDGAGTYVFHGLTWSEIPAGF